MYALFSYFPFFPKKNIQGNLKIIPHLPPPQKKKEGGGEREIFFFFFLQLIIYTIVLILSLV